MYFLWRLYSKNRNTRTFSSNLQADRLFSNSAAQTAAQAVKQVVVQVAFWSDACIWVNSFLCKRSGFGKTWKKDLWFHLADLIPGKRIFIVLVNRSAQCCFHVVRMCLCTCCVGVFAHMFCACFAHVVRTVVFMLCSCCSQYCATEHRRTNWLSRNDLSVGMIDSANQDSILILRKPPHGHEVANVHGWARTSRFSPQTGACKYLMLRCFAFFRSTRFRNFARFKRKTSYQQNFARNINMCFFLIIS